MESTGDADRRNRRRDNGLGLIAVIAVALLILSRSDAHAALPTLSQVPSGGKATVELEGPTDGARFGPLNLLVRNSSAETAHLALLYIPGDGRPSIGLVPSRGPTSALISFAGRHRRPVLAPHQLYRLSLRLRLPEGGVPSELDGRLLIYPRKLARRRVVDSGPPLVVAVLARVKPIPSIAVAPSSVTIQLTRWVSFLGGTSGNRTRVGIEGEGARTALGHPSMFAGTAILRSDGGHAAEVSWSVQKAKGVKAAVALIEVHGSPAPGTYTGTLPVGLASGDPRVAVTLHSHDGIELAVIVVLIGAVLGGLLPLLGALASRKGRLRAQLRGMLDTYFESRGDREELPASYSLDGAIGPEQKPWKEKDWMPLPQLWGAAGLFSAILWARNDDELDDATAWAEALIGRIRRWLRVDPEALRLRAALATNVPHLDGHEWWMTGTHRDTRMLLYHSRYEPADDAEADDLAARLQRQSEWHASVAAAWSMVAGLALSQAQVRQQTTAKILAIANPPQPERERDSTAQGELQLTLEDVQHELASINAQKAAGILAEDVEPADSVLVSAGAGDGQALTIGKEAASNVRKRLAEAPRARPKFRAALKLIRESERRDILLSMVLALGAVAAYAVPLYSPSWGSVTNYLTALLAGFGSQTVVRWAVLPAFRSRKAPPPPAPIPGGDGPSQPAATGA